MSTSAGPRRWPLVALLLVVVAAVWWFVRSPGEEAGSSDPTKSGADRPSIASLGDPQGEIASREKVFVDARATIRGTVRDPDGQPIAGAQVCASADTRELSEVETRTPTCAITREDGSYRIDGLFPVGHRVVASAPEHIPDGYEYGEGARRRWLVHLKPGQEAADIDITLKTGGVELTGVVRDISGGVLEGALVSANGIAFTDADGRFSLWVKPGSTSVEASAEGYAEGREYGVAPGHSFEIYLTPESVLVGKVVEAGSGAPVAGARIELGSWSARSAWSAPATFSEADGSFRVAGLQPGLYKPVAVTDERYGMASYEISLGLGQTSEPITVEVHPAFSVVGKVVTDDGSVCDEGSANLHDRAHNRRFNARAEPDGVVRFQGVLPGTYDVEAYCTNYLPEEEYAPLTVAASVDGLEWSVRSGQAIRGLVVDGGGAPLEDMYIMASRKTDTDPRAKGGQSWGNNTDAEGNFEVLGLKPGAYTLRLWGDYPDLDTPTEVEVAEGKDTEGVRIELPATGTVRGRILDRHGEPVADASATLKSLERGGMFFFSAGGQAQARDDGTFTIEHVKPGSYRATASQSWRQLRAPGTGDDDIQGEQVTVEAGETVDVELIVESAGETLRGQVVDRDGGPVIDAFIDATRESDSAAANAAGHRTGARWGSWGATPVLTDQDGRFELKDLSEGKYTVRAYRKGGGEAFEEGVATGSDVVLTLRDTGTITGSVTLNGGGAPEEFSLRLQDRAAGIWRSDTFFRTGGVFTFTELPAGKFEVSAKSGEGVATTEIELAEGEERAGVTLELESTLTVRGKVVDLDTGAPVPGIQVSISARNGGLSSTAGSDRKNITDESGHFEVEQAPTGAVIVRLSPRNIFGGTSDYMWSSIPTTIPAGGESFELPAVEIAKRRVTETETAGDLGFKTRDQSPDTDPAEIVYEVAFVRPGGPAETAGIKVGDVITAVDGRDITGEHAYLYRILTVVKPGTTLKLGVQDGGEKTLEVGPPV